MSNIYTYAKSRSHFYLKIFENDDNTSVTSNGMTKALVQYRFPYFEDMSPTGWKKSDKYDDLHNLWIPDARMDFSELESLKLWAEDANKHIWLRTNQNTRGFFSGNELDFCVASDWNFNPDIKQRTDVGEAEYQLKYPFSRGRVDEEHRRQYADILKNSIMGCANCLPFFLSDFIVTTIPAVKEKQSKLSWALAKYIASTLDAIFMEATLTNDKPQMKEQTVVDKIRIWREIYNGNATVSLSQDIRGKNILVVDDLYQSGASTWCYGEYLKTHGARLVIAISSVKALKDGDNK